MSYDLVISIRAKIIGEYFLMTTIIDSVRREILDFRGNPTVEMDVILGNGAVVRHGGTENRNTFYRKAVLNE